MPVKEVSWRLRVLMTISSERRRTLYVKKSRFNEAENEGDRIMPIYCTTALTVILVALLAASLSGEERPCFPVSVPGDPLSFREGAASCSPPEWKCSSIAHLNAKLKMLNIPMVEGDGFVCNSLYGEEWKVNLWPLQRTRSRNWQGST